MPNHQRGYDATQKTTQMNTEPLIPEPRAMNSEPSPLIPEPSTLTQELKPQEPNPMTTDPKTDRRPLTRGTPHPKNPNLLFWNYRTDGEFWLLKGEYATWLAREQKKPAKPAVGGDLKRGAIHPANSNLRFWGYRAHYATGEYWVPQPVYDRWIQLERKRDKKKERLIQKKRKASTPEYKARNAEAAKRYRERKKAAQTAS